MGSPSLVLATAAALALSTGAGAGPAEPATAAAPAEEGDFARARALFNAGRAKYDMGDYDGAIENWTESYALVQSSEGMTEIQTALVYNVTKAQRAAYEVDKDVRRLRLAKQLLQRAIQYHEHAGDTAEVERMREELAGVESKIAAHQDEGVPASGAATGAGGEAEAGPEPRQSGGTNPATDDAGGRGNSKIFLISGGAALGVGAIGLGLMAGGLAMGAGAEDAVTDPELSLADRRQEIDAGFRGNTLAVAGGIVGGIGVVAGVSLLVVGLQKRKRERSGVAALSPVLSGDRHHAYIGLRGSF